MKQVQKMQADMVKAQEELKNEVVEASAGGGMVTVKITGDLELREIRIDAEERAATTVEVRPSDPRRKADVAAAEQTQVGFTDGHLSVRGPTSGWRMWVSWRSSGSVDLTGLTGPAVERSAGRSARP